MTLDLTWPHSANHVKTENETTFLSNAPRLPKGQALWNVLTLRPFTLLVRANMYLRMSIGVGGNRGKQKYWRGEKPLPMYFCPPEISGGLT